MRIVFVGRGLERLYTDSSYRSKQFGPEVVKAYRKKVTLLQAVGNQHELRAHKALRLEKLRGDRDGSHSIRLNQQWRLIIRFETDEEGNFIAVIELIDYH